MSRTDMVFLVVSFFRYRQLRSKPAQASSKSHLKLAQVQVRSSRQVPLCRRLLYRMKIPSMQVPHSMSDALVYLMKYCEMIISTHISFLIFLKADIMMSQRGFSLNAAISSSRKIHLVPWQSRNAVRSVSIYTTVWNIRSSLSTCLEVFILIFHH